MALRYLYFELEKKNEKHQGNKISVPYPNCKGKKHLEMNGTILFYSERNEKHFVFLCLTE